MHEVLYVGMFFFLIHACTLSSCSVFFRDYVSGVLQNQGCRVSTERTSFTQQPWLVFVCSKCGRPGTPGGERLRQGRPMVVQV